MAVRGRRFVDRFFEAFFATLRSMAGGTNRLAGELFYLFTALVSGASFECCESRFRFARFDSELTRARNAPSAGALSRLMLFWLDDLDFSRSNLAQRGHDF
ncbi:MAG TPA: hypothetical protein VHY56_02635, partial [Candidatus Binataceae bacterium]|nr:hypothetical protein [Candidatus Binataceae bacterium]